MTSEGFYHTYMVSIVEIATNVLLFKGLSYDINHIFSDEVSLNVKLVSAEF